MKFLTESLAAYRAKAREMANDPEALRAVAVRAPCVTSLHLHAAYHHDAALCPVAAEAWRVEAHCLLLSELSWSVAPGQHPDWAGITR